MTSKTDQLPPFVVLQKTVGETPLECLERWRSTQSDLTNIPLAYAGRLDPMASGKLLVLIGDTCKQQANYHGLDKEYEFSVLFGVSSDSGDVLGLLTETGPRTCAETVIDTHLETLVGNITLPYPFFSSRTVSGKPLHTWAVEGRLHEITIPTKTSRIYFLAREVEQTLTRQAVYELATKKIELIPPVTDPRKALGNDFRRPDIRLSWQKFIERGTTSDTFLVVSFRCVASSGTYMRSLSEEIARRCGTSGLAWSIHRTKIGQYDQNTNSWLMEF